MHRACTHVEAQPVLEVFNHLRVRPVKIRKLLYRRAVLVFVLPSVLVQRFDVAGGIANQGGHLFLRLVAQAGASIWVAAVGKVRVNQPIIAFFAKGLILRIVLQVSQGLEFSLVNPVHEGQLTLASNHRACRALKSKLDAHRGQPILKGASGTFGHLAKVGHFLSARSGQHSCCGPGPCGIYFFVVLSQDFGCAAIHICALCHLSQGSLPLARIHLVKVLPDGVYKRRVKKLVPCYRGLTHWPPLQDGLLPFSRWRKYICKACKLTRQTARRWFLPQVRRPNRGWFFLSLL